MINLNDERILALRDVPRHLPRRRNSKRVHISCLYRWTTSGCRGVVLESIQIGGTRCTSLEALSRFFRKLTDKAETAPAKDSSKPSSAARHAATTLEREGF